MNEVAMEEWYCIPLTHLPLMFTDLAYFGSSILFLESSFALSAIILL